MALNNKQSGALGGGAQGAATGFAVGGPVGAVIGGVAGAVLGGLAGGAADKRERALRHVSKWEEKKQGWQEAMQRRDFMRQYRTQQATAEAYRFSEDGGNLSSTARGARGSAQSQFGFGLNYMEQQDYASQYINNQLRVAGKQASIANTWGTLLQSGLSAAGTIGASIPRRPPQELETLSVTAQRVPTPGATTYPYASAPTMPNAYWVPQGSAAYTGFSPQTTYGGARSTPWNY